MNIALSVAQGQKVKTTNDTKRATTSTFGFRLPKPRKCLNSLADQVGKIKIQSKWCRTWGAAVYRREVFRKVGLFDTTLQFAEDTDWFQRARELDVVLERFDLVALYVRRHSANMTRGKSLVELNTLRVLKMTLDRKRQATNVT